MTNATKLFHYHGRSMWPCFQEGDLLEVLPVHGEKIHAGDCVVYQANEGKMVVHRVIAVRQAIRTQGDAFQKPDLEEIRPEQIFGKVAYRHRLGRKNSVWNGKRGQMAGFLYRYAGRIDPQRITRGGRMARSIQGFSTFLLRACGCKGKVKTFRKVDGEDIRTWEFYRFTVAQQNPTEEDWQIMWPWKVILKSPDKI